MTDDAKLLARAKSILKELRLRRPTFLQSWMAQYVAECIESLETAEPTERRAIADRCAATITRLWKIQLQFHTNALERGVNQMLRRNLNDKALKGLRTVLDETGSTESAAPETKVTIWQLSDLERLVIEVFFAASERRKRRHVKVNDNAVLAELRDRASTDAQKTVAAVFPVLGTASLDDFESVEGAVNEALRAIDRVRRRLIWGEAAVSTSKSAPRARRAKQ
jgi:hypothetical protein